MKGRRWFSDNQRGENVHTFINAADECMRGTDLWTITLPTIVASLRVQPFCIEVEKER